MAGRFSRMLKYLFSALNLQVAVRKSCNRKPSRVVRSYGKVNTFESPRLSSIQEGKSGRWFLKFRGAKNKAETLEVPPLNAELIQRHVADMRGLLFEDDFIRHRAFMTRFVDIIKIWKAEQTSGEQAKALKEKNGKVSIRYTLPLRGASPAGHPALGEVGTSCSRGAISEGRLGNPLVENRESRSVLTGVKYASRRPGDGEPIFENMAYLLDVSDVQNRIAKIPKVIQF